MDYEKLNKIISSSLECFQDHLPSLVAWQTFPKNYCEEVSSILLRILIKEDILGFKLMRGTNKKGEFHFWLESEDFVIDLTAHQFEGFDKPFLLISKSEYPLYKVFNKDIQEKEIHPNWPGLENISSHIQKKFYAEYY